MIPSDLTILSQNPNKTKPRPLFQACQKGAAYALIASAFLAILFFATDSLRYDLIISEKTRLINSLLVTLYVSLATLVISMAGGFLFFLALRSKNTFLKTVTDILKEIVMGTPLLVMVFLVVYVFGTKVGMHDKLTLGIVALTLYMIPYNANAFASASAVIDNDQYTVMDLYHISLYKRYRYIILPQMIKPMIPLMLNNLSSIIKGSALLKIVSVSEISYVITVISNKNYASIEGYLVMWVMYLMITIPLSLLSSYFGRKFS
jgi:His/Glu/Gln/Arg/opine family amino acid ABC transporter permease subunit